MIDKDTYKKELVRMWDSVRTEHKGEYSCTGVKCINCLLENIDDCGYAMDIADKLDIYNNVEKWSKEHPQKHKISQLEYDILKSYLDYKNHMTVDIADYFFEDGLLLSLLKKGYFKGANEKMNITYYLRNCEVVDNDNN